MSEGTRTITTTPPRVLTPEELLREEMNTLRTAMWQSEAAKQQEIARMKRESRQRDAHFQNRIRDLDEEVKREVLNNRIQMQDMENQFYDEMNDLSEKFQEEMNAQSEYFEEEMAQQMADTEEKIEMVRQESEQRVHVLEEQTKAAIRETHDRITEHEIRNQKKFDDINQRFESEAAKKKELLSRLKGVIISVSDLQHEKYAPGSMDEIINKTANLNGMPDTAVCAIVHDAITDLNNLGARIEKARLEYERKHVNTVAALEKVLAEMNENRRNHCPVDSELPINQKDEKGNVILSELDFWSEGEYGELYDEINSLRQKVTDGKDDPAFTINDLDDVLKKARAMDARQNEIVLESIKKGNASQIRAEMADTLVDVLRKEHGYECVERGYEVEDQRNGYIVKLRSEAQRTNLVVMIHPERQIETSNVMIGTDSEVPVSDALLLQRAEEVNCSLRKAGIEVGNAQCTDEQSADVLKALYDDAAIMKSGKKGGKAISESTLRKAGLQRNRRNSQSVN